MKEHSKILAEDLKKRFRKSCTEKRYKKIKKPMSVYDAIHCMKKLHLPKKEIEERVCELLKQRVGVREIAATEHLSFRDIKKIKDKYFETDDDDSAKNSKRSRALTLMEEGTSELDIAIELNLSSDEIEEFRQEYLKLKGEDQLLVIYRRIGGRFEPFLTLYEMMNKENLSPEEAIWALQDYGSFENINEQFTHLTKKLRPLKEEVDQLENQRQELDSEIDRLTDEIEELQLRKQEMGNIMEAMTDVVNKGLQNSENTSENTLGEPYGQLDLDWIGKSPGNPESGFRGPHRRKKRSKIRD